METPPDPNILYKPNVLPTAMPGLSQMAFNLSQALIDNLKSIATKGVLLASPETLASRISICTECEFFKMPGERCSRCGCYMNIKARLLVSKCPVGKWQ